MSGADFCYLRDTPLPVVLTTAYMGGRVHLLPWEENTAHTHSDRISVALCRSGGDEAVGIKTQGTGRAKPTQTSSPSLSKWKSTLGWWIKVSLT